MTKKLTNTQIIEAFAVALKQAQEDISQLQRELKLVNNKLKKYENKTIGGFNAYVSHKDITNNETDF